MQAVTKNEHGGFKYVCSTLQARRRVYMYTAEYWNLSLRIKSFIQTTSFLSLVVILIRIMLVLHVAKPSGLVFVIDIGFGILFSSNSSMMLGHQTKFKDVNPCHLTIRVTIDRKYIG